MTDLSHRHRGEVALRERVAQSVALGLCSWAGASLHQMRGPGRDGYVPVPITVPCLPSAPSQFKATMGALPGKRRYLDIIHREWHPADIGKPMTLDELRADQAILESRRISAGL